jgi:hypothetical protein
MNILRPTYDYDAERTKVKYEGFIANPSLDGLEVEVKLDDSFIADCSTADSGIVVNFPDREPLECEIWDLGIDKGFQYIEIYPLDGRNNPIEVRLEAPGYYWEDENVLTAVVKALTFHPTAEAA